VTMTVKTVVFWAVILISALLLFQVVKSKPAERGTPKISFSQSPEISYSQFMAAVESGDVAAVTITGNRIHGQYRNNGTFWLFGPANQSLFLDSLRGKGVDIWFEESSTESLALQLLGTWAPLILLGALWFFMVRQMRRRAAGVPMGGTAAWAMARSRGAPASGGKGRRISNLSYAARLPAAGKDPAGLRSGRDSRGGCRPMIST
jgi:ATP-dependent Zn protease